MMAYRAVPRGPFGQSDSDKNIKELKFQIGEERTCEYLKEMFVSDSGCDEWDWIGLPKIEGTANAR